MAILTEHSSLRQGLVGAWCPSLGASGLSLIDRSGQNAHASGIAGLSHTAIQGGLALQGNGTSTLASIGDLPQFRVKIATITGWFRAAAQGANARCVFASYSQTPSVAGIVIGVNIAAASQNRFSFVVGNNAGLWFNLATDANVCDDVLHSFACVVDTTSSAIYIDGVLSPSSVTSGSSGAGTTLNVTPGYASTNFVAIGAEQTGASIGKRWSGFLDDIRIYNRVLTHAEIRLLASRRGIGLTPLRDRAAGLPRRLSVNVGGTWREADSYVNVGGVWKLGQPSVNVGGTWR